MTAVMMTTKTTTTIMIVVVLSFLGLAPRGVMLFSEIKFWKWNQYKQVKVKLYFWKKQNVKYKSIQQYHLQRMNKNNFYFTKSISVIETSLFDRKVFYKMNKQVWVDNIRIQKIISAPIWGRNSALLNVRHCAKLQSWKISRKTNHVILRKWQKPKFWIQFGTPKTFFMGFTSTSR